MPASSALRSPTLPRLILAPKPPRRLGQSMPRLAAVKPPRPISGLPRMLPRKKSRRDMPRFFAMSVASLELEEHALLPREHEVVPGAAEQGADRRQDRREHHEEREEHDRELAVLWSHRRVLVDVRERHQDAEPDTRDEDARDLRVEVAEQLLE